MLVKKECTSGCDTEIFCSFLHSKIKQTLHCLLLGFPIYMCGLAFFARIPLFENFLKDSSQHLLVQSQWKHQTNVLNMSKVKNKQAGIVLVSFY